MRHYAPAARSRRHQPRLAHPPRPQRLTVDVADVKHLPGGRPGSARATLPSQPFGCAASHQRRGTHRSILWGYRMCWQRGHGSAFGRPMPIGAWRHVPRYVLVPCVAVIAVPGSYVPLLGWITRRSAKHAHA